MRSATMPQPPIWLKRPNATAHWLRGVVSMINVLLTGVPATPSAPTSADNSRNCHTFRLNPIKIVGMAKPRKPSTR